MERNLQSGLSPLHGFGSTRVLMPVARLRRVLDYWSSLTTPVTDTEPPRKGVRMEVDEIKRSLGLITFPI